MKLMKAFLIFPALTVVVGCASSKLERSVASSGNLGGPLEQKYNCEAVHDRKTGEFLLGAGFGLIVTTQALPQNPFVGVSLVTQGVFPGAKESVQELVFTNQNRKVVTFKGQNVKVIIRKKDGEATVLLDNDNVMTCTPPQD